MIQAFDRGAEPAAQDITQQGMIACEPPNQSPAERRCFGSACSTERPLQIAMAKASMETPIEMAMSSPIPIFFTSQRTKKWSWQVKKETYLPKQVSLVI